MQYRKRIRLEISGLVQGVGFRPYVRALAESLALAGHVRNETAGLEIELEGAPESLARFVETLQRTPPENAYLETVTSRELPPLGTRGFQVVESKAEGERSVFVAVDTAVCADCLREFREPGNRRYGYVFINCAHCGPRYSITRDMPYDRERTTMARFEMCAACRREYEDPKDRRFHAQATCCPACGPRLVLLSPGGEPMAGADPLAEAMRVLLRGGILAVKGIGGFHLACDASNDMAVERLRTRKHRDLKPFAVMARDAAVAQALCHVDATAEPFLEGRLRPIVLLRKREGIPIAATVAPRNPRLGLMLPYTPLHTALLAGPLDALVMTSGNISDEPIAFKDDDALSRLGTLADAFLTHDREIHVRTDDSVAYAAAGAMRFLRRSRGYAPFPVRLSLPREPKSILATGAELSAAICISRGQQAFLSHHLGDLANTASYESFLQAIAHLRSLLGVSPAVVACDLHPACASTRYARTCGLPVVQVQHHHAHIASVLAEAGHNDKVIGLAFDGFGWGEDHAAWGGEFLLCDVAGYTRAGHFEYVPQPGGDAAAKSPARMAYAYLAKMYGDAADRWAERLLPGLCAQERSVLTTMIARKRNSPLTSSVGRLFDAASALLGVCDVNTFHAQAPMELEAMAWRASDDAGSYDTEILKQHDGQLIVPGAGILRGLVDDYAKGVAIPECAARFHNALVNVSHAMCRELRIRSGIQTVALGGGVFANIFLVERLKAALENDGFDVLMNAKVPPGDGGISLGQAAVAARRL